MNSQNLRKSNKNFLLANANDSKGFYKTSKNSGKYNKEYDKNKFENKNLI
jgi:hypothetical protein